MFGARAFKNISNNVLLRAMKQLSSQPPTPSVETTRLSQANILSSTSATATKVSKNNSEVEAKSDVLRSPTIVEQRNEDPEIVSSALLDVNKQQDDLLKLAMSFDDVPGPTTLKTLAKIWSYVPILSTQATASAMIYLINMLGANLTWSRTIRPFNHIFDKYGPVVRIQGPLGGDIVFLSRPEHIEMVYRQEGRYPVRSTLDSLEQYRLKHRKLRVAGPFIMSGPDWESMRAKMEVPLQRSVAQYCDQLVLISEEFVTRIRLIRSKQEEVPANFNIDIYKWSLECVALVALDRRVGCLEVDGSSPTSESSRLLEAMLDASSALRKCESGFQFWRFLETPSWRKLVSSCDIIDRILMKYVRLAQNRLITTKKTAEDLKLDQEASEINLSSLAESHLPLLDVLLLDKEMFPEDALTMVLDMLLIGVNSTAHAMGFLLYHLAKSPRVQRELYEELLTILPNKDSKLILSKILKLRLLQACVKESLRLRPPIPVMTRVLPRDIALHAYRIPKGTYMLMPSHVLALREENFEDANKFKPERWLTGDKDIHPFATIPFGHGPRSCVARNVAELQLWLLTANIVRNFKIEYNYGTINTSTKLIAMPDKPLKFRFVERVD